MIVELEITNCGSHAADIREHGSAFLVGRRITAPEQSYLYTPATQHIWLDCGGGRCCDLGQLTTDTTLPDDDSPAAAWEEWAATLITLADRQRIRIYP